MFRLKIEEEQLGTMHGNILKMVAIDQKKSSLPYLSDTKSSAAVHSVSEHLGINAHEKENQPLKPSSPVLTGTGNITHNIAQMIGGAFKQQTNLLPNTEIGTPRMSPYDTTHFMSFRHENNDLHNEGISQQMSDVSNNDMSISTEGSISPRSSSTASLSPQSVIELSPLSDKSPRVQSPASATSSPAHTYQTSPKTGTETSPDNKCEQPKKNARTNFSTEQVEALLKIFHENPYPESAMMEDIGKDLGITEKQVKIWFQNKRSRWRRRSDNQNNQPQHSFFPMSPMLSPVASYGFMPNGHMMTPFPLQNITGYTNFNWKQGYQSPNNNQQLLGPFSTNHTPPRYQTTNQIASFQNEALSMAPRVSTLASHQMMNYNKQSSQFPQHKYQTTNASTY